MILNRKINIKRKSQTKFNHKSNNHKSNNQRKKSKKNQRGGNYFLGLDQPRIGGLSVVSYQDDLYAQSAPNINVANMDPNLKNVNSCLKGGSRNNKKYSKRYIIKGGNGNFSDNMNTRRFDCYQPNWSVDCV